MKCIYDPLTELMAYYADKKDEVKKKTVDENLSIEEKLRRRIIDGDKIGIESDLDTALKKYSALEIINDHLLDGMKTVGELFGSGEMQLPFVLQSAECMKAAVKYLEPFMEKKESSTNKGTMVLATVKGDVHDIGKNLVDIILTNNGYKVINLGIKCPLETMLAAYEEHKADAIGMSGLLVKSTAIMKENLETMNERKLEIPVVLGGAALNRRFVEGELRAMYKGDVYYANDAFDGLKYIESIVEHKRKGIRPNLPVYVDPRSKKASVREEDSQTTQAGQSGTELNYNKEFGESDKSKDSQKTQSGADIKGLNIIPTEVSLSAPQSDVTGIQNAETSKPEIQKPKLTSNIKPAQVPTPPFLGSKIITNIRLEKIYEYINEVALFRGSWNVYKDRNKPDSEYEKLIEEEIRPKFNELKLLAKRENLLQPQVIYGYYPCASEGNELIIYKPEGIEGDNLYGEWQTGLSEGNFSEWKRFNFPRQQGKKNLCISDFFRPVSEKEFDVIGMMIVTVGKMATEYAQKLYSENKYQEYLYFHGFSVETAEALAEYWHKAMRVELGIAGSDSAEIKELFHQGYQGSRYSFGYPACPNLEDNAIMFDILRPERIGIELTEEFQMVPEQTTNAIVVHHPEAKYFFL